MMKKIEISRPDTQKRMHSDGKPGEKGIKHQVESERLGFRSARKLGTGISMLVDIPRRILYAALAVASVHRSRPWLAVIRRSARHGKGFCGVCLFFSLSLVLFIFPVSFRSFSFLNFNLFHLPRVGQLIMVINQCFLPSWSCFSYLYLLSV